MGLGSMIMQGNEEAWVEMLLQDKTMLEELGLPLNMSPKTRAEVKQILLNDIKNFPNGSTDTYNYDIAPSFDTTKTPAEQFLSEALAEMGISDTNSEEVEVSSNDLKEGGKYILHFPNGNKATVILNRIQRNSFGDDYIFKNISGAENLTQKSGILASDEFPLPIQLVRQTKFTQIK